MHKIRNDIFNKVNRKPEAVFLEMSLRLRSFFIRDKY